MMVRICPWRMAFVFLWLVTLLYFLAHRETRVTIRRNIQDVFSRIYDHDAVDTIFRSALKGIFYHYVEKLYVAYSGDRQWKDYCLERIRVIGRRTVDRYLRQDRGVILVTAHFGAVEFLPGLLTLLGYPVAIIAKFKTPRLKKKCEKRAHSVGAMIIDANEPSSFFLALSALRQGRILITQCDEVECWRTDPERTIQVFGTFFRFDRTPTILQKRSGCPIVFGYVRREGKGHYAAEIEDVCGPYGGHQDGIGVTLLKKLEKLVYTHPDQWYIWKNFQRMKATEAGEIVVEGPRSNHIPVAPPTVPILQAPRSVTELHGQYCPQASM